MPSAFEIGLSDCRWIYCLDERTVTVQALAEGDEPAMQWRIVVEGKPCRFLVFGHLVLGERELDQPAASRSTPLASASPSAPTRRLSGVRDTRMRSTMVASTQGAIEAISGDELLYVDGRPRDGAYLAMRTRATGELCFAVAGSLIDPEGAERLAAKYGQGVDDAAMLTPAARYWEKVTRGLRITGSGPEVAALDTHIPVARAQRHDPPHRAARPGAVHGRRMGHARRLPGTASSSS